MTISYTRRLVDSNEIEIENEKVRDVARSVRICTHRRKLLRKHTSATFSEAF